MSSAAALGLLLLFLAIGQDVAVAVGLVAVILLFFSFDIPSVVLAQVAFGSLDSYALVAIPLFVLAGNLATRGDIAGMIFSTLASVLRCVRGGMAVSLLVATIFFSAMNGSSVACTVAMGPAAIRMLPAEGYPKSFAAALVAVAGTLGIMIPPSLAFIVIGAMMELPILDLFIAGILPGLMEGALLILAVIYMSRRHGYGVKTDRPDWQAFRRDGTRAAPAMLMPLLIIGGLYLGIMTPTEISAFAVAYAAVLGLLVYRTFGLRGGFGIAKESLLQTMLVFMIIMSGTLLSVLLVRLGVTEDIIAIFRQLDIGPIGFLILANLILLLLGTVFEGASITVLAAPIMFPIATEVGINPIHFAVIFVACCEIATLTPPVGMNLFVMARVSRLGLDAVNKAVMPFFFVRFVGLLIINAFPWLSLALI